jgi:hypothetical protein
VRFKKGTPAANLHVAMLHRLGVAVESIGDSSGMLEDI